MKVLHHKACLSFQITLTPKTMLVQPNRTLHHVHNLLDIIDPPKWRSFNIKTPRVLLCSSWKSLMGFVDPSFCVNTYINAYANDALKSPECASIFFFKSLKGYVHIYIYIYRSCLEKINQNSTYPLMDRAHSLKVWIIIMFRILPKFIV